MGYTNFPYGITSFGVPIFGSSQGHDISGVQYFCDANIGSAGDGSSWDEAFSTLTSAMAASQAQITLSANRAWAKRNTIYYVGDWITETLTTAAQQTDIIGVGADTGSTPRLLTNWTIATARSSFRIINLLIVPQATDPGITFPAAMHGWELHNVTILKHTSYTNTAQLLSTDSRDFVMTRVRILPDNAGALSTIGFNIGGTTNGVGRAYAFRCEIHGIEAFNVVDTSAYYEGAVFEDCLFKATNLCIDENSDSIAFKNCRLHTAANSGSGAGSTIVDWNAALCCGNEATSADHNGYLCRSQWSATRTEWSRLIGGYHGS